MSLHLEFEPHSWYKGFAIKHNPHITHNDITGYKWEAYTDDGMHYTIVERYAMTLTELKKQITQYRSK